MFQQFRFELRHSFRALFRTPAFSLVFMTIAALSFASLILAFSVFDAITLREIVAPQPESIAIGSAIDSKTGRPSQMFAETLRAFEASPQRAFSALSAYSARYFRLEAAGLATDAMTEGVWPSYFSILGAHAQEGRLLTAADASEEARVVLSWRFRQRVFGVTPVVGSIIRLDGKPVRVVGVSSPGFDGLQTDGGTDLFLLADTVHSLTGPKERPLRVRNFVGHLAPSISLEQAAAEFRSRWPAIQAATIPAAASRVEREALASLNTTLEAGRRGFSTIRNRYGSAVPYFVGLTFCLLLMAASNLMGLTLVRSLQESGQVRVRMALGASPARATTSIFLNSALLCAGGFLLATPLALVVARELDRSLLFGRTTPLVVSATPGVWVLSFAALAAIAFGLAIAAVPSALARRADSRRIDDSSRTTTRGFGWLARTLLGVQLSLSVVTVCCAMLFATSLDNLRGNLSTASTDEVALTRVARRIGDQSSPSASYWQTMVEELSRVPGGVRASLSEYFPTYLQLPSPPPTDPYTSMDSRDGRTASALTDFVSPGFFETYAIEMLRGRDFEWTDGAEAPPVAIISASFERGLFGEGLGLGRPLRFESSGRRTPMELTVVGVVSDLAFGRLRDASERTVFRPILQAPRLTDAPMVHLRYQGSAASVADAYKSAIERSGHHYVPVVFTFSDFADSAMFKERMIAAFAVFAGGIIVGVASLGVFAILAYSVACRQREIGIRTALGAERRGIAWLIIADALAVAAPAVAFGLLGGKWAGDVLRSQLYAVNGMDGLSLGFIGLSIVVMVLVSAAVPALRAMRVEPLRALREE